MKKTLLSSMIIILMGLLGACSSNTSDKTSLSEQSVSENKTATPVAIEVPDTLGKTYDAVEVMPEFPDRKSTRLNSSHPSSSRMPSSA